MELREKMCTKLVVAWSFKVEKMRSIIYLSNIPSRKIRRLKSQQSTFRQNAIRK